MAEFNYHQFLRDKWGDPDRLVAFLHAYGETQYQRPTVNQWFRRRSIPTEAFAKLQVLLETDTGSPVSMVEYLK